MGTSTTTAVNWRRNFLLLDDLPHQDDAEQQDDGLVDPGQDHVIAS